MIFVPEISMRAFFITLCILIVLGALIALLAIHSLMRESKVTKILAFLITFIVVAMCLWLDMSVGAGMDGVLAALFGGMAFFLPAFVILSLRNKRESP